MKKIFKGIICLGLAGAMSFGIIGAAGCNKDGGDKIEYSNPESRPLRLAIGAVDEKFNPLYYTSLNDGIIANLTQVSLVTADAEGKLAYGEDEPTVALDYVETYKNGNTVVATGDGKTVTGATTTATSTTYEFLIKKGMKFSDGKDLTVMDVLFNLYVYLDPLYSGSNTIYSTKIKGLQAYRTNTPGAPDTTTETTVDTSLYTKAADRYNRLYNWADGKTNTVDTADLNKIHKLYKESLYTDWNSIETSYAEAYKKYYFDEAWKAFLYMEGAIADQTKLNDNGAEVQIEDANGKYLTVIDPDYETGEISQDGNEILGFMAEEVTDAKISTYIAEHPGTSEENAKLTLQKEAAIDYLYDANTGSNNKTGAKKILINLYGTIMDEFYNFEVSNKVTEDGGKKVDRIEGITVSHTADSKHNGTFNGNTYDEDHDILSIEIAGIDPKAKWNFGFTVAPMHHYSSTNYNGTNYVAEAMEDYTSGKVYAGTATHFGVEYSNTDFIDDVLSASDKNGLPVGAGAYKCCTNTFGQSGLTAGTFFFNYMAFFERNTYFETMGSGIENAKIKYVTYAVTKDDQIVNKLKTKEIDYGEPIATANNQSNTRGSGLKQITYKTGGYGYVGINPKSVPDITIRRAIMKAFDTSHIRNYYGSSLVDVINRPMSTTSWVWKYVGLPKTSYYERATKADDIKDYIEANSNWRYRNGKWRNSSTGDEGLSFTFTIAGETTDHPAYDMFEHAAKLLRQAGFSISVETDIQALQKLTTGNLEVWAAAWSSSIDPDPYQIYSINSRASSTKNWNKDGILSDQNKYATEYEIALALNNKILAGRQTLDEQTRAEIYAKSADNAESYADMCALDLIMELAVEFPTYQRYDLCVYNGTIIDRNSMTPKPSYNMGPISELWKVNYHVKAAADSAE